MVFKKNLDSNVKGTKKKPMMLLQVFVQTEVISPQTVVPDGGPSPGLLSCCSCFNASCVRMICSRALLTVYDPLLLLNVASSQVKAVFPPGIPVRDCGSLEKSH